MKKSVDQLYIFFERHLVGTLFQDIEGVMTFQYSSEWCQWKGAFALSPIMPLEQSHPFGNAITRSYFENLLPEGNTRDRINFIYRNTTKDSFHFLSRFGEDCAGALIITKNRSFPEKVRPNEVKEVSLKELDSAVEENQDLTTYIHQKHQGRFSLAGAQDKFAFIYHENRIYIPTHGGATTHILKPIIKRKNFSFSTVINEHFCMSLAKWVGLNVPPTDILRGKYHYFIIDRFDREIDSKGYVRRLHQFDFCQAQGFSASKKYEDDQGPTLSQNYQLIKERSRLPAKDLELFLDWLVFNLIIGNNDSHSKNLSFLYDGLNLRLSPFYDLLSTIVYPSITSRFAFGFGKPDRKQYLWHKLKEYHLINTCRELGLHHSTLKRKLISMCSKIEINLEATRDTFADLSDLNISTEPIEKMILKRVRFFQNQFK